MTKYFVTYCVMDGDTGSNIFWHACLILSQQEALNEPVSVIDSVGFYSDLSTTTNPIVKGLKNLFGCKFNLQDCHGFLKQEEMRYLDSNGLHGISFETTKDNMDALIALYKENMALEQAAICELDHELIEQGEPANSFTRYVREKAKATLEERSSRLQPFHLTLSINRQGFDSTASNTCKTYALQLLLQTRIIDQSIHENLLGGAGKYALPRYSGVPIIPLRLISTGEPEIHESRKTKAIFYNRTWGKNSLFWASSLHIYEPTSTDTSLKIKLEQHQAIKDMLTRIQKTEVCLRHKIRALENQPEELDYQTSLKEQLQRVLTLYDLFKTSYENQWPHVLAEKLLRADRVLNIAQISLKPDMINHSFMIRAFGSLSGMSGVVSVLILIMLCLCFDAPIDSLVIAGLGIFAGHHMVKFAKEEAVYAKMHDDYSTYIQNKRPNETVTALEAESAQPAYT